MCHALRTTAVALTAVLLAASHALAQQPSLNTGRVTFGIAAQGGTFDDDDQSSAQGPGFTVGLQGRHPISASRAFVTDITVQPVAVSNPNLDQRVRTVSLQFGVEFGRRLYVRPSGGIGLGFWSGSSADSPIDLTPSIGFAVGLRRDLRERRVLSPELFVRAGGSPSAFTWIVGFQLGMGS
jgi:hypothetical protein